MILGNTCKSSTDWWNTAITVQLGTLSTKVSWRTEPKVSAKRRYKGDEKNNNNNDIHVKSFNSSITNTSLWHFKAVYLSKNKTIMLALHALNVRFSVWYIWLLFVTQGREIMKSCWKRHHMTPAFYFSFLISRSFTLVKFWHSQFSF